MRLDTQKSSLLSRILCALLCLSLVFSMLFMSACNTEEEPEATEPEETQEVEDGKTANGLPLNENGKVNVVVFTQDAPRGTKVSNKNTETIELDATNVPKNVVTDYSKIKGLYTDRDFYAGDYIIKSRLVEEKPIFVDYSTLNADIVKSFNDFLVVTDYVEPNTGKDLYGNLQTLIDLNPGKTFYFPDGEYIISRTLETSSRSSDSISFYFSSGAILRAHEDWVGQGHPLIGLGAKELVNDISKPGSNFFVMGGTFDGNGVADGIAINAGRETLIKDVVIINTRYGIHIPNGTNGSSSDADIDDVTIIGNGEYGSKGIYIVGLDNTVTDARVSNVEVGIHVPQGVFVGNCTVIGNPTMQTSTGIHTSGGDTWTSKCNVIDCDTAYAFDAPAGYISQCTAKWTQNNGKSHVAFRFYGKLRCCIISCKAEFFPGANNAFLVATEGGSGRVVSPIYDPSLVGAGDKTMSYIQEGTSLILPAPAYDEED